MAKSGVDYEQLQKMQQAFEAIVGEAESGIVYDEALKDVGRRHLARCVQNTPFGKYKPHAQTGEIKLGGTLRKGWVVNTHSQAAAAPGTPSSAEISAKVSGTPVKVNGSMRTMTFFNRVNYALFVDLGHRQTPGRFVGAIGKRLKKAWIPAQNFIRNSENGTASEMPRIIERHMRKALKKRGIG